MGNSGSVDAFANLERAHESLCAWVHDKPKGAVRSSLPAGIKAVRLLKRYASALEEIMPSDLRDSTHTQISRGKSNLPECALRLQSYPNTETPITP